MTSRKLVELGVPFTLTVNNSREQDLEVKNLHETTFDELRASIVNSTSYAPPVVFVTDELNKIVKIKFTDTSIPANSPFLIRVNSHINTVKIVEEKKVLIDGEKIKEAATNATSTAWRSLKIMFFVFLALAFFFYLIRGSTFGNIAIELWSRFNAAQVIKEMDELDPRIHKNIHEVYQTAGFTEMNALYKRNHGRNKNLAKLYNYVGNDFFVTKDLIYRGGRLLVVTWSDAQEYCELAGGRLLKVEELNAYLAGRYITVENFLWPIKLRPQIPEWSKNKYSWPDNYVVYNKDGRENEKEGVVLTVGDDGSDHYAFRCGFVGNIYLPFEPKKK